MIWSVCVCVELGESFVNWLFRRWNNIETKANYDNPTVWKSAAAQMETKQLL